MRCGSWFIVVIYARDWCVAGIVCGCVVLFMCLMLVGVCVTWSVVAF